ncbi:MAG: zf-HC2 domain-containing protein [Lachnospiraceae bacterium]|nr:zf-HC2 domain-containing protein [Lachnospiraceae bacterium]
MDRTNCNIIKDLLPSYMEDICSADSRELIEEHLNECRECRNLMEMITATEIVSEKTSDGQIDYMKKVREDYTKKNIISFGLLVVCLIMGLMMGLNSYRLVYINIYYCYIIVPIVMTGVYLILSGRWIKGKRTKWEFVMGGIGGLLIIYCIALRFAAVYYVKGSEAGASFTGVSPDKIGVFLHWQLLFMIGIQVVMMIVDIIASFKTRIFHGILMDIHGTGACLAFAFCFILSKLTTLEDFKEIWNRSFFIVLAEGILMAVTVMVLKRKDFVKL